MDGKEIAQKIKSKDVSFRILNQPYRKGLIDLDTYLLTIDISKVRGDFGLTLHLLR